MKNRISYKWLLLALCLALLSQTFAASSNKKVYMHYMAWFGPNSYGRHWNDGVAQEPLIGYYDSRSWATQIHHILLSSSCGIDGLVLNVKDHYDEKCLRLFTPALNRILAVDPTFDFQFAVSYDDQGMDNTQTAEEKFVYLRDHILPNTESYIKKDNVPAVFIWNYPGYLTAKEYHNTLDKVFSSETPIIIWNEINEPEQDYIESFYPWVQGFAADGSNWGEGYLNWFYNTIGQNSKLDFVTAGVYPGFDDRKCSWGQNRWINRRNGQTYSDTWNLVHNYKGTLPLDWVYLETWNDWNEGTQIEPSVANGFTYLLATINQINAFKSELHTIDDYNFLASTKIYEAALMIEDDKRDSVIYYPMLEQSIAHFLNQECSTSIECADQIIDGQPSSISGEISDELDVMVYPNPVENTLYLNTTSIDHEDVSVALFDLSGVQVAGASNLLQESQSNTLSLDVSRLNSGVYMCVLTVGTKHKTQRVMIK